MSLAPHLEASRYPRTNSGRADLAEARLTVAEYCNSFFWALGPQRRWLGNMPFEVIVAAILAPNTAWTKVEQASNNLRSKVMRTARALELKARERLAELIRPSGYFRQKAKKLKAFVGFLRRDFRGPLVRMFRTSTEEPRGRPLAVRRIGPETADSILLYAGGHPVFVEDAYTKRILVHHGWMGERAAYDDLSGSFENSFDRDAARFDKFHALIVQTGKRWRRPCEPLYGEYPLGRFPEEGR